MRETDVMEAGYVRLRQHVIDMIARSGSAQKKIPSVRELGKSIGMSHFTAIKAIRDLIDDGYLETRAGVGTFTRPGAFFPDRIRLVAYVFGDGKNVFYDKLQWNCMAELGNRILGRSSCYRLQNHFITRSSGGAAADVAAGGYDGVVWLTTDDRILDQITELKRTSGIPLVCIGGKAEGVSSFHWQFSRERYEITRKLLSDGTRRILTVIAHREEAVRAELVESVRRAHEEMGVAFDGRLVLYEDEKTLDTLSGIIDFGLEPDAIAFSGTISPYYSMLTSKLDCENKCTLVSGSLTTFEDMCFSGLMVRRTLPEAMRQAAENLFAQIDDPERAPVVQQPIGIEMVYQKRGKDYE